MYRTASTFSALIALLLVVGMPSAALAAGPGIRHVTDRVYDLEASGDDAEGLTTGSLAITLDLDGRTSVCGGSTEIVGIYDVGWDLGGCGVAARGALVFDDSTSVTLAPTTVDGRFCDWVDGSYTCTPLQVTISASFTATGKAEPYHVAGYDDFGTCFVRYSVAGSKAPVTGSFTINGRTYRVSTTLEYRVIQQTTDCPPG